MAYTLHAPTPPPSLPSWLSSRISIHRYQRAHLRSPLLLHKDSAPLPLCFSCRVVVRTRPWTEKKSFSNGDAEHWRRRRNCVPFSRWSRSVRTLSGARRRGCVALGSSVGMKPCPSGAPPALPNRDGDDAIVFSMPRPCVCFCVCFISSPPLGVRLELDRDHSSLRTA